MLDFTKTSTYSYNLDENLIAQTPIQNREKSKMLALNKSTGCIEHHTFSEIYNFLNAGDCLVINNTRVIPARLYGKNPMRAGEIEIVLLERESNFDGEVWKCITRPGKKTLPNDTIIFENNEVKVTGKVLSILEGGLRQIKFEYSGIFNENLDSLGLMPLPPYITTALEDRNRYQTVYAKHDGSAAAPTAGLHFTSDLIDKLKDKGIIFAEVLLHVGLGTFRPVKEKDITKHHMHSEYIEIDEKTADTINKVRENGGKIICVGTTSCRVVESVSDDNGLLKPYTGYTDIFLYPPYKFKATDALITNFHLPESTLLMLVSAFGGYDYVLDAYKKAVYNQYRFFSFGDAMYIY